jgi:alkanesulfonate monooxygenase SsuD/methylene tetrahydromethanopterin reductase-like flavin-dependent oxidoreductase (luciferase family)
LQFIFQMGLWFYNKINDYSALRNIHCANLSTRSARYGTVGSISHDIAPGRLRLGIGPSHQTIIEDIYSLSQTTPLAHLHEYVKVLRAALWEGKVDHHGRFFNVMVTLPRTAPVPVLISTLGKKAFQLAGEIADGALSWVVIAFPLGTVASITLAPSLRGREAAS